MKEFNSLFVPNLSVDLDNFLVENILHNKITFFQKKGKKIDIPRCAFWRKDVVIKDNNFEQLKKDYIIELQFIKKLRKCFSGQTILSYIKERNLITIVYLDLDKKKTVIYNLFDKEIKLRKEVAKNKKKVGDLNIKPTTEVQKRKSPKNKLSNIL